MAVIWCFSFCFKPIVYRNTVWTVPAMWFFRFMSCFDLMLSRFCTADYRELGIMGIKVHRITRIYNRMLRLRFDDKLSQTRPDASLADDQSARYATIMSVLYARYATTELPCYDPWARSEITSTPGVLPTCFNRGAGWCANILMWLLPIVRFPCMYCKHSLICFLDTWLANNYYILLYASIMSVLCAKYTTVHQRQHYY